VVRLLYARAITYASVMMLPPLSSLNTHKCKMDLGFSIYHKIKPLMELPLDWALDRLRCRLILAVLAEYDRTIDDRRE